MHLSEYGRVRESKRPASRGGCHAVIRRAHDERSAPGSGCAGTTLRNRRPAARSRRKRSRRRAPSTRRARPEAVVATRDARVGSTHAAIRDHADRDGRTHGRGDDPPGDHPKVDRRAEGCDRREREGRDAEAQGGLEEVRSAEGRDRLGSAPRRRRPPHGSRRSAWPPRRRPRPRGSGRRRRGRPQRARLRPPGSAPRRKATARKRTTARKADNAEVARRRGEEATARKSPSGAPEEGRSDAQAQDERPRGRLHRRKRNGAEGHARKRTTARKATTRKSTKRVAAGKKAAATRKRKTTAGPEGLEHTEAHG